MRFFSWLRKNRATINGVFITIATSLVFNTISDAQGNIFEDYKNIGTQLFEIRTLSGFLTVLSLISLLVFNLVFIAIRYRLNRTVLRNEFLEYMKSFTSPQIADSISSGCLSWGEGKTLEICNDIILGWYPKNILIDEYDDELYQFYSEEEKKLKFGEKSYYFNGIDWYTFKNSDSFVHNVIRRDNNLPRFMLKQCSKNYNKKDRKLLLSLARTEWSQTSYIWDKFGKSVGTETDSNDLMKEYAKEIKSGDNTAPYLPNSFCMHLIIESLDNKVVLALVSESKRNDNPGSWAATIGEQLEFEDFSDGNNFYDDFIIKWMRRAFLEEFKISGNLYHDIVDEPSLKCLSVNFESDRYNFSLLCTVRLRYSFDKFYEKTKFLLSTEENSMLKAININEIPDILINYENTEERKKYHPSTFLRLLVFFVHKNGYSKAERILLGKNKNSKA